MRKLMTSPARDLKNLGKLLEIEDKRDRLLFACGLFIGMRGTSELCRLRWKDLLGHQIQIYQPKTRKTRIFLIPDRLKQIIKDCYEGQNPESYVFAGRRGQAGEKSLTNRGLNLILRKYWDKFGIEFGGNNSSHALRKTFSKAFIAANGDSIETLELLRRELNHSSIHVTMVYAGITGENHAKMINKISY